MRGTFKESPPRPQTFLINAHIVVKVFCSRNGMDRWSEGRACPKSAFTAAFNEKIKGYENASKLPLFISFFFFLCALGAFRQA